MLLLCQNPTKLLPPPLVRLVMLLILNLAVFERLHRRCGLRVSMKLSQQWSHRGGPRPCDWNLSLSFTSEMHSWYIIWISLHCCNYNALLIVIFCSILFLCCRWIVTAFQFTRSMRVTWNVSRRWCGTPAERSRSSRKLYNSGRKV